MKRLIITGDDFGLSLKANEAIEEAHRQGALTTASLMVGASATVDAVERARRLPTLKVGLHLVLVDGVPLLSPREIPDLVDEKGLFSPHLVRSGINFFMRPEVKKQLEAEMDAQFGAFYKTGLYLDHVNTHHHLHLHPTLSCILLKVGKKYGMRAVRLPYEPLIPSWRASRNAFFQRLTTSLFLLPWITFLRKRLKHENVHSNQFLFGMNDSSRMDLDLFLCFLQHLPQGVTEIYFHPGDNTNELEALTHPAIPQALLSSQIQTISFSDL
jgi:hopanoid biosynthesis associated protein HpnK